MDGNAINVVGHGLQEKTLMDMVHLSIKGIPMVLVVLHGYSFGIMAFFLPVK
jgi:hypothetical protein